METGARKKVIETLTWAQVDFEAGVIHYRKPGDRVTKKRRPSVPISRSLMPILRRAYAERKNDLVLETSYPVNARIARIAANAKIDGLTPNVLRHTAATWMARRGVPLWQIAGVLGNSLSMVEKVYAKHCPEGLAEAVEQISRGSNLRAASDNFGALRAKRARISSDKYQTQTQASELSAPDSCLI